MRSCCGDEPRFDAGRARRARRPRLDSLRAVESTVISLAAAPRALAAGARAAKEMGVAVSLAIVDAGGILGTFARMDGAEIVGEVLAVDKAFTAVSHRTATADLAKLAEPGGELFGLHANGRGRYVPTCCSAAGCRSRPRAR
jgi:uncharacterized protein GlcG (DUF336 family)